MPFVKCLRVKPPLSAKRKQERRKEGNDFNLFHLEMILICSTSTLSLYFRFTIQITLSTVVVKSKCKEILIRKEAEGGLRYFYIKEKPSLKEKQRNFHMPITAALCSL